MEKPILKPVPRGRSSEAELDAVPAPRVVPPDRAAPDVAAHDPARAELDAPLRVVHELALVEAVHLGRAHVQARLRLARAADLRVDRDERLLVRLEPVEGEAVVDAQRLVRLGFRGVRHGDAGRTRGSIFIPDGPAPSTPPVALSAGRTRCEDITGGTGAPGARPGVTDDGRAPERGTGRERAGDRRPQPPIRPPARPRGAARRADPPHPPRVDRPDPEAAGGGDGRAPG